MSRVKRLQSFDTDAEAKGQTIMSIVSGAGEVSSVFESKASDILAENGISNLEPDEWYPLEDYLRALDAIDDEVGSQTIESIGETIPEQAEWPPEVDGPVEGLESVGGAYDMNHRGGDVGFYEVEAIDDSTARVSCENPYSCALDRGILRGTTEKFTGPIAIVNLEEVGDSCRENGGGHCVYELSW